MSDAPATGSVKEVLGQLFARLNPVESAVQVLETRMTSLEGVANEIKDLVRQRMTRGTDWGVLLGAVGIILTIGGQAAAPMVERISKLETEIKETRTVAAKVERLEERSRWMEMIVTGNLPPASMQ